MLGSYPAPNPLLPEAGSLRRKQQRQLPAPQTGAGWQDGVGSKQSYCTHIQCRLGPGRRPATRAGTACGEGGSRRGDLALQGVKAWTGWLEAAGGDSAWEGRQSGPGNLKMSREWVLICLSREGSPRDEEQRMERGAGIQSE